LRGEITSSFNLLGFRVLAKHCRFILEPGGRLKKPFCTEEFSKPDLETRKGVYERLFLAGGMSLV